MKKIIFITILLNQLNSFGQNNGDTSEVFNSIGIVNIDSSMFYLDYAEVSWLVADTLFIDLNQLTNRLNFESGLIYEADLSLANLSGKTIKLFKATRSCSCLLLNIPTVAKNPNESFTVGLKLKPISPGIHEEKVEIYFYDEALVRPLYIIPINLKYTVVLNQNE